MINSAKPIFIISTLSLVLAGCGGSSSSNNAPPILNTDANLVDITSVLRSGIYGLNEAVTDEDGITYGDDEYYKLGIDISGLPKLNIESYTLTSNVWVKDNLSGSDERYVLTDSGGLAKYTDVTVNTRNRKRVKLNYTGSENVELSAESIKLSGRVIPGTSEKYSNNALQYRLKMENLTDLYDLVIYGDESDNSYFEYKSLDSFINSETKHNYGISKDFSRIIQFQIDQGTTGNSGTVRFFHKTLFCEEDCIGTAGSTTWEKVRVNGVDVLRFLTPSIVTSVVLGDPAPGTAFFVPQNHTSVHKSDFEPKGYTVTYAPSTADGDLNRTAIDELMRAKNLPAVVN